MSYDQILQNALYEQNPNLSQREISEKADMKRNITKNRN